MKVLTPDLELLCLLDPLRPKNFRVSVIKPDGSTTDSPKFTTKVEAHRWAAATQMLAAT